MEQQISAYQILGLQTHASSAQVKAAYRKLVRQWHPDQFVDTQKKQQAEAKIKEINIAYEFLKRQGESGDSASVGVRVHSGRTSGQAAGTQSSSQARVSVTANAAERKRKRAESLYQQAQGLVTAERYREATDALDQAIRICDDYLEAYEYRALLYEKRGFERLAQRDFAKVRELKRASARTAARKANPTSVHRTTTQAPRKAPTASRASVRKDSAQRSRDVSARKSPAPADSVLPLPFQHPIHLNAEIVTNEFQARLHEHSGAITAIALLRKNNYVTASQDGSLRFWQFKPGSEQSPAFAVLSAHEQGIEQLTVSPDGQHLASYGKDGTIKLWQVQDARLVQSFSSPPLVSLCFGPKPQALTGCDRQGIVRQWNIAQAQNSAQSMGSATYLAVTQNLEYRLVRSSDQGLCAWPAGQDSTLRHLDGSRFEQTTICISDDDQYVAAGDNSGKVFCWHLKTGQVTLAFSGFSGAVQAIAINPDRIMAVADSVGDIWVIDVVTRKLRAKLSSQSPADRLCFAPSYNHLLSGHRDGSVQIWRV